MKHTTANQAIHAALNPGNAPEAAFPANRLRNSPRMEQYPMTVTEALKSEINAYSRSGAIDACECCMIAMEQVARRFRLTLRQVEQLFCQYA